MSGWSVFWSAQRHIHEKWNKINARFMRWDLRVRVEKCLRVRRCYDQRSIKPDMLATELWLDAGRDGLGFIFFFSLTDRKANPRSVARLLGWCVGKSRSKHSTRGQNLMLTIFFLPLLFFCFFVFCRGIAQRCSKSQSCCLSFKLCLGLWMSSLMAPAAWDRDSHWLWSCCCCWWRSW